MRDSVCDPDPFVLEAFKRKFEEINERLQAAGGAAVPPRGEKHRATSGERLQRVWLDARLRPVRPAPDGRNPGHGRCPPARLKPAPEGFPARR